MTERKRRAPTCARCRKPIRKGESISTQNFGTYRGLSDEGQGKVEYWLGTIEHSRCWEKFHDVEGDVAVWRRVVHDLAYSRRQRRRVE